MSIISKINNLIHRPKTNNIIRPEEVMHIDHNKMVEIDGCFRELLKTIEDNNN